MLADTATGVAPATVDPGVGDVTETAGPGLDTMTGTDALAADTDRVVSTCAVSACGPVRLVVSHCSVPLQTWTNAAQVTVPTRFSPSCTVIDAG